MTEERNANLEDLLHGQPTCEQITPPVTTRIQVLPFNQLSWENFERLCTRLINRGDVVEDCHRYGKRGDYQAGIDILAHHGTADGGVERWGYQCKRWKKITPGDLREIVKKFACSSEYYVVLISVEAGADLRKVVAHLPNVDLWDSEDLSSRLKDQASLVEDFFGAQWRVPFCTDVGPALGLLRMPNPFTDVFAILDPARFIGRQAALNSLLRKLQGGSVALVGSRKIGKSSLVLRLRQELEQEPGQVVISWDFFEPGDVRAFLAKAIRELGSSGESWEDFKQAVHRRRVVVMLDEFDVAPEQGFDLDFVRVCRGRCQKQRGLRFVTCSCVLPWKIFGPAPAGSTPYDFLMPQELGPFSQIEARRLLAHPWAPDALHFDEPTCTELIALSGCHPYKLQRAAHHRYEVLCNRTEDWHADYELDLEALQ